ncbi:MAG TPA: DUF6338 family protein [Candidatus Kapabacteria bacterium]|nr:DUF6338 family protein [Candidatus Kapabacteria bacterium]
MVIWSQDKLILFIAFVIPGFIAIKVYEILYPGKTKETGQYVLDAVTYSCINYALLSWALVLIRVDQLYTRNPVLFGVVAFFVLFMFPILWVWLFAWVRTKPFFAKRMQLPDPKPWDYVFRKKESFWIIIHFAAGGKIGGIYDAHSYTSAYPEDEQIYLEEVWELGEKDEFLNPKERSKGILVSMKDIKAIEFFK